MVLITTLAIRTGQVDATNMSEVLAEFERDQQDCHGEKCLLWKNPELPLIVKSSINSASAILDTSKPMKVQQMERHISTICDMFGVVGGVTPHSFRRGYCKELTKVDQEIFKSTIAAEEHAQSMNHTKTTRALGNTQSYADNYLPFTLEKRTDMEY